VWFVPAADAVLWIKHGFTPGIHRDALLDGCNIGPIVPAHLLVRLDMAIDKRDVCAAGAGGAAVIVGDVMQAEFEDKGAIPRPVMKEDRLGGVLDRRYPEGVFARTKVGVHIAEIVIVAISSRDAPLWVGYGLHRIRRTVVERIHPLRGAP
jgi:hypothetical protein